MEISEARLLKAIEDLSNVYGLSGHEDKVIEVVKSHLDKSLNITVDEMNNTVVTHKDFDETKPYMAIDAHMDEVGLMVQAIKANGLIKIVTIGGWQLENLITQSFMVKTVDGDYVKGVIASVPPHFKKGGGELSEDEILFDVGASSKEEVLDMGIKLGAPIVPNTVFYYNEKNRTMMGKAFDDRMGLAVVVSLMNYIAKKDYTQVVGFLASQEEVGLRGARVLAQRYSPEMGVCFEGTPADDTVIEPDLSQGALGKGVQIRLRDGTSIMNPKLANKCISLAEENNITHQVAVRRGGGTNAGAYHLNKSASPSTVFGVPARYIHSHTAISKLDDYISAYELGVAVIDDFSK